MFLSIKTIWENTLCPNVELLAGCYPFVTGPGGSQNLQTDDAGWFHFLFLVGGPISNIFYTFFTLVHCIFRVAAVSLIVLHALGVSPNRWINRRSAGWHFFLGPKFGPLGKWRVSSLLRARKVRNRIETR